ncbi:ribbon-helix-helix domain-containing protein [uncultured Rhodoblastus sp.]|uniref:ribbon-helix-helix domain-containing protein n=1 Tax=uncultured Rhodoblastus sp. TaxID=543037 RepID=UPI0025F557B6|nr:ribbon-helix-helix domain-containing protein [uncultured Rhodoblastus sp.]
MAVADPDPGQMRKHSLVIAGHRTSISLETAFWDVLRELARQQGVTVAALAADIDRKRGAANLSSALRVHLLQVCREKAAGK